MTSKGRSRWEDEEDESVKVIAQRKKEREEKKRAKEEKLQRREDQRVNVQQSVRPSLADEDVERPSKRTRMDEGTENVGGGAGVEANILAFPIKRFKACRNVEEYERLNDIEEGSYGLVSRARERATGTVVALKKLKMDHTTDGFPVTGLREIQTLMASKHAHIVHLREVVMGSTLKDIYLVMDFIEHDLKTLLEDMDEPFLPSEIKTLMVQIVSATEYLHSHWILHRDLKTSNLLMNNRGEIKLADFGMARYTASPVPKLTQLVVTLWYRAPELLLGAESYDFKIDIWSLGCIFGELVTKEPLFGGKNEVDQLSHIFASLGRPTKDSWPDFRSLPNAKALYPLLSSPKAPPRQQLSFPYLTQSGVRLIRSMLALNPANRPTASEILSHPYLLKEDPRPKAKEFLPTFPSKAGQEKRRRRVLTPNAPIRGEAPAMAAEDFARGIFGGNEGEEKGAGFALRLG